MNAFTAWQVLGWFLALAVVHQTGGCAGKASPELQVLGNCQLQVRPRSPIPVLYRFWWAPQEGQGFLRIDCKSGGVAQEPFEYKTEPGQEFLVAAYPQYFGDDMTLLVTRWECGAVCQGVRVYGPVGEGRIGCLFEGASRFGFRIVRLHADGPLDIVGCEGDVGPSNKTVTVYSWDGKGFSPRETFPVQIPHLYAVKPATAESP